MTYELNESHFFDVLGINQVKTFSYLLNNKSYDGKVLFADITINLTYYDNDLQEKFINLAFPLELAIDNYSDDCLELKNVNLLVIENQGVKLEFDLEVWLADTIEELPLDDESDSVVDINQEQLEKKLIQDEYQESLEESMKEREGNICMNKETSVFNPACFKTSHKRYRLLFVDDEAKIDSYSNQYALSVDELYKAKKHNQRLIVDVSEND